jgi:hypothetical protein
MYVLEDRLNDGELRYTLLYARGHSCTCFFGIDKQRVLWQVVLRPKSWNFSGLTQFT